MHCGIHSWYGSASVSPPGSDSVQLGLGPFKFLTYWVGEWGASNYDYYSLGLCLTSVLPS